MLSDTKKIGKRSISNEHYFNFVNGQLGDNMRIQKIGSVWKVWFLDFNGKVQTVENQSFHTALCMMFINKTTELGE